MATLGSAEHVLGAYDSRTGGDNRWVAHSGWFGWLSWKSVFAGVAVAMSLQVLLTILGMAIGLTIARPIATDAANPSDAATGVAIGAGLWWILSGIISLGAGGIFAAHYAGTTNQPNGAAHGLLVWAVMLLVSGLAVGTGAAGVLAGGVGVLTTAMGPEGNTHVRDAMKSMSRGVLVPATGIEGQGGAADRDAATAASNTGSSNDGVNRDVSRERTAAATAPYGYNPDGTVMTEAQAREAVRLAAKGLSITAWWAFASLAVGAIAAAMGGGLCAGSARHAELGATGRRVAVA
jgi:hypothetical protein